MSKKTMGTNPLVSVCIPVYNNAPYIKETVESVAFQTYPNIELIIVDDCSKDDSWEVINRVKEELSSRSKVKLRLYRNTDNLGMVGNWNRCLELCEGEYIKLLCADDLLDRGLLEKEVSILKSKPEVVCVSSDTQFIDSDGVNKGYYKRYHKSGVIDGVEAVKYSLFTRDYLGAPLANLVRKSVVDKIGGFDPAFTFILDYDFFIRVYMAGMVFILHEPLNFFRIRRDSNTGQVMGGARDKEYIREHRLLVEKHKDELHLSRLQVEISVLIRNVMSFLGKQYLRLRL